MSSVPLPVLRVNDSDILHPFDVSEEIARTLSERCRGGDRQAPHQQARQWPGTVDFRTTEHFAYNEPFSMIKLTSALSTLRSVSEGPGLIHSDMLRHLPAVALEALLAILNSLWESGAFPASWRQSMVIPILKPVKSGLDSLNYRPISLTRD